ncbi:MAG: M23 family metallopeptidase [Alphaproteobacteria bacterium]|nr:M23 family metallopeptidase [Alphaproteobacteria bacterium]
MKQHYVSILSGLASLVMAAAAYGAPQFGMPIQCEYGKECFIQKYVDLNPSKNMYMDYMCGTLSSEGHNGTDFRLRDFTDLQKNVPVVAAEAGVVKAMRDGMEDVTVTSIDVNSLNGMYCGNAVLITHKDGYETQYCHMKKGSINVQKDTKVEKGDIIGYVGLSGDTEYPHLHFSLRHKENDVDPFVGDYVPFAGCDKARYPLWDKATLQKLTYIPTGLLNAWYFSEVPKAYEARNGVYQSINKMNTDTTLLVFATDLFGAQKGDVLHMEIRNPKKAVIIEDTHTFDSPKAQFFHFIGKYRKAEPWLFGKYVGSVKLTRNGKTIFESDKNLMVE